MSRPNLFKITGNLPDDLKSVEASFKGPYLFSVTQFAGKVNVARRTARIRINKLVKAGLLERVR